MICSKIYLNNHKQNFGSLKNPGAFLGTLTSLVRAKAGALFDLEKGTILDACCGNGLFFLQQNMNEKKVTRLGLDISYPLLSEQKKMTTSHKLKTANLVLADVSTSPFADQAFDKIFCLNSIINFKSKQEIQTVLEELKRICKTDGHIIFDVRNGSNLILKYLYQRHTKSEKFPIKAYKINEMVTILDKLNLSIQSLIKITYPWKWICWAYIFIVKRDSYISPDSQDRINDAPGVSERYNMHG